MQDFRKLDVWGRAYKLTLAIYKATAGFPVDERFGLTSQIRRAAASIAANIAEGCGRDGNAELRRFLQISMGSASELEFHLQLATDLGMLEAAASGLLLKETIGCKRMLAALIVSLRASKQNRQTDLPKN